VRLDVSIAVSVAFVTSLILTAWVRKLALEYRLLDLPNDRSSHVVPTPRGGGIGIVVSTLVIVATLAVRDTVDFDVAVALIGGGLLVAGVGFIDDRRPLSARLRLTVHFAAAAWAMAWLGGLPPMQVGATLVESGWWGYLLGAVAIVWVLNLFNFMDGIDGIAAAEAVFIATAATLLPLAGAPSPVALVFAAACAGFLAWNWPPARIFMGDVGSGFLGYFIAVAAVVAARESPVALFVWLTLGGVFFADSTVTLVRRMVRGERVDAAHRSHAYQRLARRWGSHRRVTVFVTLINLFWLVPWAYLASMYPAHAVWFGIAALVPLGLVAWLVGAGRAESAPTGIDSAPF
jgi:Fuc2NAc and GlcNAc transferase